MNAYALKWAAAAAMVVDHVGILWFPGCAGLRIVGRIAFPVFAFLLVEGVLHTSDIRRYARRLALFAFLSEIPYDLAFSGKIVDWQEQNVFFTLLICLCLLGMLRWECNRTNQVLWCLLAMWLAELIRADYGSRGVLLVLIFYGFRERKAVKVLASCIWMALCDILLKNLWQRYAFLGIGLCCLYNGEEGKKRQRFFYCFYPVHLIILYMLKKLI